MLSDPGGSFSVFPLAVLLAAHSVVVYADAMLLAVPPLALVLRAACPLILPVPCLFCCNKVALVRVAIGKLERAFALIQVALPATVV